jgi:L-galactose dehydrogenase
MEYTMLGNTGLRVGVAGLGCGGFSQLGLAQGKSEADAIAIIRQALELGVNLFDTAAAYGTEEVLGKAIKSVRREDVVICTKAPFSFSNPHSTPEGIVASLDNSLRQLDTDYIDVYQLHGVPPSAYDHALNDLAAVAIAGESCSAISALPRRRRTIPSTRFCTGRRRTRFGMW